MKQKLTLGDVPKSLKLKNGRRGIVAVSRVGSRLHYRITWNGYRKWPAYETFGKHRTIRALLDAFDRIVDHCNKNIDWVASVQSDNIERRFADDTPLTIAIMQAVGFRKIARTQAEWSLKNLVWSARSYEPFEGFWYLGRSRRVRADHSFGQSLGLLSPKTIGDLRWLCWKLNIPLKEPS